MEDIFEELHYEFINSEDFIQFLKEMENIYRKDL